MGRLMDDPTMPARPPIGAGRAIEQIKGFRSWEPVEIYRAIRDVLQEADEYPPPLRMPGDGRPPRQ